MNLRHFKEDLHVRERDKSLLQKEIHSVDPFAIFSPRIGSLRLWLASLLHQYWGCQKSKSDMDRSSYLTMIFADRWWNSPSSYTKQAHKRFLNQQQSTAAHPMSLHSSGIGVSEEKRTIRFEKMTIISFFIDFSSVLFQKNHRSNGKRHTHTLPILTSDKNRSVASDKEQQQRLKNRKTDTRERLRRRTTRMI